MAVKDYNAEYIFVGALTLFETGKKLYYWILERNFPELIPKYGKLFKYTSPTRSYQDRLKK